MLQEIRAKSQEDRRRLEEEARAQRERLLREGQAAVEAYRRSQTDRATREIVRIQAQETASTELELKREELHVERELLDRVMHFSEERLRQLPRERNEAVLKALLARYEREGVKVLTVPRDELYLKMASKLHHEGTIPAIGGLVITNVDGTVRVDLTYDTLLHEFVERNLKDIHGRLFHAGK